MDLEAFGKFLTLLFGNLGALGTICVVFLAYVAYLLKQEKEEHKETRIRTELLNEKRREIFDLHLEAQRNLKAAIEALNAKVEALVNITNRGRR